LLEVASLVAEASHGKDPDLVIAALLHDEIEDQEVPYELIAREFGKRVADVVKQVTDDKALSKEARKENQIKTAYKKSKDAKIVKLADKTSNMRAITFSPAPNWSVKRRLKYIDWAREVVVGLRGASPWLEQQFDDAAAEAEGSVAVRGGRI
jgi:(p)ppGpp synthase/HD superfamily hydrolase